MKQSIQNILYIAIAILLFICAIYIYVSNRDGDMVLYKWMGIDFHNNFFEYLRKHSYHFAPWIRYNLPDGLWMLSFLLFMEGLWNNEKWLKWLFCIPVILSAYVLELLQYYGFFPGTSDLLDILAYTIAILLYLFINKLKTNVL